MGLLASHNGRRAGFPVWKRVARVRSASRLPELRNGEITGFPGIDRLYAAVTFCARAFNLTSRPRAAVKSSRFCSITIRDEGTT